MTNIKATKRALGSSVLALFLCFAMLLGTTFAWFTDSVTSANNVITAGNLDVELEYKKIVDGKIADKWASVNEETKLFDEATLWEPGHAEVVYLKVSNLGTLALKYQLSVTVLENIIGYTVDEKIVDLREHLVFKVVELDESEIGKYDTRKTVVDINDAKGLNNYLGATKALDAKDGANDEDYVALIVYMPETVGNEANYRGTDIPYIKLGVNLFATQYTSESDSFGSDYDAGIDLPLISTGAELKAALASGQSVKLNNDIEIAETIVIPAPAASTYSMRANDAVVIDLNGNTINVAYAEGSTTKHKYAFENYGNLVITGNGTINARGIFNYGNMVLESGTINAIDGDGGYAVRNYAGATFTMNGGKIATTLEDDNKVDKGGYDATTVRVDEGATFVMNGGTINNICDYTFAVENHGKTTINAGTVTSVHSTVSSYGELTIKGGSFTCNGIEGVTAHALVTWDGSKTDIYGGTFNGKDNYNGFNVDAVKGAVVNIYGGNFLPVHSGSLYGEGTINVYGGTFFDDPSKRVAEDYKAVENKNGTYTVLKGNVVVNDNSNLSEAINGNGNSNIALGNGNFSLPETSGDITISGTLDSVITIDKPTANNITLNGVTVVGSGRYTGIQHSNKVVYENCVIKGVQFLYANEVTFINCTIDLTEVVDYIWTYGAKNVTFDKCVFNTNGKAILVYSEDANLVTNVTVKNCTFNATESALAGGNVVAAIEIDSSLSKNGHYTLTTENNTVDSDFSGEWRVKKSGTNNTTVNGVIYNKVNDGLYKGETNTYYVYNASGLATLNAMMADKSAGKDTVVNLIADIDFEGKTWTPIDSHADTAFYLKEINGNGHTISNLTINGQAMFTCFAGFGDVTIKDITFDNATVNSNAINTSILTVQSYQNILLDNVDVKNSTITGAYKVAPLIATVYNESSSTITATLKNCDVENVTVTATAYDFCTTGMVAFVYADDNDKIEFENCTVTNVKLYAPNSYTAHAAIYTTGSETLFNEAEGVTVTNVTFANK